MRRTRTILLSLLTVFLLLLLPMAAQAKTACAPTKVAPKPTHVLIIVLDQMRPEYVNLFNMKNVRWLAAAWGVLPQRVRGRHGGRDGGQPQRDGQRPVAETPGLV